MAVVLEGNQLTMAPTERDERYLSLILDPLRVCADYRPKMGMGVDAGVSLQDFQKLYRADRFYAWFGLDNPLMYAAHKAAGGMTSVYRQIGIGCEHLFRAVLQDELDLSEADSTWSYSVTAATKKARTLSLDARIPLDRVTDKTKRDRVKAWMAEAAGSLKVQAKIARQLSGVVFEVRQGYKSKDSKRQNADLANAATAYTQAYLPCVVVLSNQIDSDIVTRYRAERWAILTGEESTSSLTSTYAFTRQVVGYDLAAFFERHRGVLRKEVERVLEALLRPEASA